MEFLNVVSPHRGIYANWKPTGLTMCCQQNKTKNKTKQNKNKKNFYSGCGNESQTPTNVVPEPKQTNIAIVLVRWPLCFTFINSWVGQGPF